MNELHALNQSIELWKWLADNFPKQKRDYPKYHEEIKGLFCSCPMCHYVGCFDCCLRGKWCGSHFSHYDNWSNYIDLKITTEPKKKALKSARKIVERLKERKQQLLKES